MDLIVQASCGLMSVTGTPAGEQVRCGHSVADITAGMFALIGILMALRAREHTGVGQFVDVSMLDSMLSAMTSNFVSYLGSGILPRPMGTAFATIVPYRAFAAQDRAIALAVGSEKLWAAFCDAIGRPDLTSDPRYVTNTQRVANRGVLEPMLEHIFLDDTAQNWERKLSAAGVPCAPVRSMAEVVNDPQAAAREMFPEIEHPTAGRFKVTGPPIKFSDTPGRIRSAAPLLGQDTRQALGDLLGLEAEQLNALESQGVILQSRAACRSSRRAAE